MRVFDKVTENAGQCPNCDALKTKRAGKLEIDGEMATQYYACSFCGYVFTENFTYVNSTWLGGEM